MKFLRVFGYLVLVVLSVVIFLSTLINVFYVFDFHLGLAPIVKFGVVILAIAAQISLFFGMVASFDWKVAKSTQNSIILLVIGVGLTLLVYFIISTVSNAEFLELLVRPFVIS